MGNELWLSVIGGAIGIGLGVAIVLLFDLF
jgi:hypothetical protein